MDGTGRRAGHAFISYVREDAQHVDLLQRTLETAGIPVWRDTADLWPGEDWRAKIRHAISDDALVFIACFSRRSLARDRSFQNEELLLAIEQLRQRRPDVPWLIPVRFDECNIPDRDLGGGSTLNSLQRADLFGAGASNSAARLVTTVHRILGQHDVEHAVGEPLSTTAGGLQVKPERGPVPQGDGGTLPGRTGSHIWLTRRNFVLGTGAAIVVSGAAALGVLLDSHSGNAGTRAGFKQPITVEGGAGAGHTIQKSVASFGGSGSEAPGAIAFSPDGSYLATAGSSSGQGQSIKLWNMQTRQVDRSFGGPYGFGSSVAVSPDGLAIAAGYNGFGDPPSNGAYVWTWADLTQVASLVVKDVTFGVNSVSFSPDSSKLVVGTGVSNGSGSNHGAGQGVLWQIANQNRLAILSGQTNIVNSAVFSPDGKRIATASGDGSVWIWDTTSAQHVATLSGHLGSVNAVAYSPNGRTIATGSSDTSVRLWDALTGAQLAQFVGQNSEVNSVSFSADGKILASGGGDNFVMLWDPINYRALYSIITEPVWLVLISPVGQSLVTLSRSSGGATDTQALSLWSF